MSDNFSGVTASFDKSSYNAGETITITIAGVDVLTQTTTTQAAITGTINLTAADGSTDTISFPAGAVVNTTTTVATNESVKMTGLTDPNRTWTVAANGLTATATA